MNTTRPHSNIPSQILRDVETRGSSGVSRCESRCSHTRWVDRHPTATTTLILAIPITICAMLAAHPLAGTITLLVGAAAGLAWLADRERSRREAIAARADRQHQQLITGIPPLTACLAGTPPDTPTIRLQPARLRTPPTPAANRSQTISTPRTRTRAYG
ncbi:hypothetical protein [Mycobacterium heckeshornense]|uniref:Uncharacterized protein n=1 Tax=Mycobacterium heckeshornense TaxID=110505 RepID=A0A7R7GVH7_9MYCO|nr:hypothetical protein [Mycobacterium heckeshornense]BCO36853.1 hypothetical protein MHEC_32860 [Mycobacterium heckeshornense]